MLVPLKATLGFLLSVVATLGAVVAVFQWGWLAGLFGVDQTGPIMSMLPIFLIGIVFGLAMDYEVFLVSRMREEYVHGAAAAREAVVTGFTPRRPGRHRRRDHHDQRLRRLHPVDRRMIKSIGFALAVAVLFDAFVVRMTIVPAVMALLGQPGVVAAALAGPAAAERRRRGRTAAQAAGRTRAGFRPRAGLRHGLEPADARV